MAAAPLGVIATGLVGDFSTRQGGPLVSGPLRLGGNDIVNIGGPIETDTGDLQLLPPPGRSLTLASAGGVEIAPQRALSLEGGQLSGVGALEGAGSGITVTPVEYSDLIVRLTGESSRFRLAHGISFPQGTGVFTGFGGLQNTSGSLALQAGGAEALSLSASGGHALQLQQAVGGSGVVVARPTPGAQATSANAPLVLEQGSTNRVQILLHPETGGGFSGTEPLANTAGIYFKTAAAELPQPLLEIDAQTSLEHGRVEGSNTCIYSQGAEVIRIGSDVTTVRAPLNLNNNSITFAAATGPQDPVSRDYARDRIFVVRSDANVTTTGQVTPLTSVYSTGDFTIVNLWGAFIVNSAGTYQVSLFWEGTVQTPNQNRFVSLELRIRNTTQVLLRVTDSGRTDGQNSQISMAGTDLIYIPQGTQLTMHYDDAGGVSYQCRAQLVRVLAS